MLKVGITGGIGSGKSIVCQVFSSLGIPIYDADKEAAGLVESDQKIIAKIKKEFGNDFYNAGGDLDRKKMADLVFNNKAALEKLNSIVHPVVIKQSEDWAKQFKDVPYVIREAAILFESGANKGLDKVIMVTAPEELRIKRVMERDHKSKEEVQAIIQNQSLEKDKIKRSDFVIINDESKLILPQVLSIHQTL